MYIPITPLGHTLLHEELRYLRHVRRPEVSQRIHEAVQNGDLKENAEYHSAKEEQGLIEFRIKTLNHILANARVITLTQIATQDIVLFGAKITLMTPSQQLNYQIVSSYESLIIPQSLSIEAPLAKLLIGKKVGAQVTLGLVQKVTYTLMKIVYE
jgi:transcription elongation factor GreA